jgi:G patch domain/KOW motif-containing protein
LDDGSVLDGVKEQYLETVIPSTGAECMVVSGEYMGQKAVLLEKRKEEEAVVVQLKEDLEVVVLSMDAIAATKA